MTKRAPQEQPQRPLLSLWEPPQNAGKPVGMLATTFTFDAAHFEEECLARFAGIQSNPSFESDTYVLEREEKLSEITCMCVIVDVRNCRGERSLRWDLLAARPKNGIMHAKISLLAWENHVRIIIASANLTDAGYRSNQECAAAIDIKDEDADVDALKEIASYLGRILKITTDGPGTVRAKTLLAWVTRRFEGKVSKNSTVNRIPVLIGPGSATLFEQLETARKKLPRATSAHIVSPFFDKVPGKQPGPEHEVWTRLLATGDKASAHFHVGARYANATRRWRLAMPQHLLNAGPAGRPDATMLHPVEVDAVPTTTGHEERELHAKSILLTHPEWAMLCIGSSNFTRAGTGLNPRTRNFEANLVYTVSAGTGSRLRQALHAGFNSGADALTTTKIDFMPAAAAEIEDPTPPLPAFFAQVIITGRDGGQYQIELTFEIKTPPQDGWTVQAGNAIVVDQSRWTADGAPPSMQIETDAAQYAPSVLLVKWKTEQGWQSSEWPVNIKSPEVLPPPEELQKLALAELLEIFTSGRPLHETLKLKVRTPRKKKLMPEAPLVVDPHCKVDTSDFLVSRVKRCAKTMSAFKEKLEDTAQSVPGLVWRINGPLGGVALATALHQECDAGNPDEWGFVLCEFVREVAKVNLDLGLPIAAMMPALNAMRNLQHELNQQLDTVYKQCSITMRKFIRNTRPLEP